MKLIVGLGNPGKKYENTRHNVGYMVVDALKRKNLPKAVVVKKTGVFVNESGEAVKKLVNRYSLPLDRLYVIHDDLDILLGQHKIQFGRGPKEHKGIESINQTLGTSDYWRVRVGVDNRSSENRVPGEEYVLQNFTESEMMVMGEVIKRVVEELL